MDLMDIVDTFNPLTYVKKGANLFSNEDAIEDAQETYDEIAGTASGVNVQNEADLQAYYDAMAKKYAGQDEKFQQAIEDYLGYNPTQVEDFSYNGDINQFFDPAAEIRKSEAMNAINNSASAEGNRFSSDYINRVANKQQALASEEWEKAYNKLMADKQSQMQEWQANANNKRANDAANIEKLKGALEIYGAGNEKLDQALEDLTSGLVNGRNQNMQTVADIMSGKANLGAQKDNGYADLLSLGLQGLGIATGASGKKA